VTQVRPFFVSTNKTFEKKRLADFEMHEPHDYTMTTAPKTFMTKDLSVDWLNAVFPPWIEIWWGRMQYQGPLILLLDRDSFHVTPRVLAYAGSQRIIIIQLVVHSSHLTQPLDLCVFGILKVLYKKGNKVKELKGETLKIYRALAAFHKSTIIPMVSWHLLRAGFRLNPRDLLVSLTPAEVLYPILVSELPLEEFAFPDVTTLMNHKPRAD
jgi:hypothetical protein